MRADEADNEVLDAVANVVSGRSDLRHVLESVARSNKQKANRHAQEMEQLRLQLEKAVAEAEDAKAEAAAAKDAAVQIAQEVRTTSSIAFAWH
jgi:hypothetical protein